MPRDEERDFDRLYPIPRLIHRTTEFLPDEIQQETSLYLVPTEDGKYWLEQAVTVGDWTVKQRVELYAKQIKLLSHTSIVLRTANETQPISNKSVMQNLALTPRRLHIWRNGSTTYLSAISLGSLQLPPRHSGLLGADRAA